MVLGVDMSTQNVMASETKASDALDALKVRIVSL